jgi:electron transport complex protein RnfG
VLIVTVYQLTRPAIEHNRAVALQRAILDVLPAARSSASFRRVAQNRFGLAVESRPGEPLVHAGYDDRGRLVGLALEARFMGYQDAIRVLYGYSPDDQTIIGLRVLESRETPGLGDRIETDARFLENFQRLDVSLSADLSQIAQPIEPVKRGARRQAWQVEGISGATISSSAVARGLRESTAHWIPPIQHHLDDFRERR